MRACGRCVVVEQLVAAAAAASCSEVEIILQEGRHGVDASTPNHDGISALVVAAEKGLIDVTQLLLRRGADPGPSANGAVPLVRAAQGGNTQVVLELLRAKAPVNDTEDGCPALVAAAQYGRHDSVSELLLHEADIEARDATGSTALMAAAGNGHTTVMQRLLQSGAARDAEHPEVGSVLTLAALGDHRAAVLMLLGITGLQINHQDPQGRTALSLAAEFEGSDVAELLLESMADPNIPDCNDEAPLAYAAKWGIQAVLDALLAHRALVDHAGLSGRTALIQAAASLHPDALSLLLAAGAQVNLRDAQGYTALTHAYEAAEGTDRCFHNRKLQVLTCLAHNGADPDAIISNL